MAQKEDLIKQLIDNPREFTDDQLDQLAKDESFSSKELRSSLLRLFDIDAEHIRNDSVADKGLLGRWNRKSFMKREKLFWKRIKRGNISKLILAEGDSWFEYPKFISEIIDQLNKRKHYAIHSLAYGGDWIANILFEKQYIEKLSLLKPDVFLISGGGNDIVGGYRLAQLVHNREDVEKSPFIDITSKKGKLEFSNECFNKEFYRLLKIFALQYKLLFESIKEKTDKFENLKIITQGYDYAIPSTKKGFGLNPFRIFKPITNCLTHNGKWLKMPLLLRGYRDVDEQKAIVFGMIEQFNEMIIKVGAQYKNVYHIDSRGSVDEKKGWYNELHPHSNEFKKIADVFEECIESSGTQKRVWRVAEG